MYNMYKQSRFRIFIGCRKTWRVLWKSFLTVLLAAILVFLIAITVAVGVDVWTLEKYDLTTRVFGTLFCFLLGGFSMVAVVWCVLNVWRE